MALMKTSIFLFFLIIGTSVFPSGSSIGQAYGKPMHQYSAQDLDRYFAVLNNGKGRSDTYGSSTYQFNNKFELTNVDGVVDFGSSTHQKDNNFQRSNSGGSASYGSSTIQGHNSYSLSNIQDRMTFGSSTLQEGNHYF